MFRRALYIPRQSASLTGYHRLIPAIIFFTPPQPRRQFHSSSAQFNKPIKGTIYKMRDEVKDAVSSSNSHLDSSIAEDPSERHIDESWKLRAPYQIQKDEEFGPVKWEAMCHCGNVQYQIKRERPLAAKYCHCRACQVLHAAPFQWCAIFFKTDIRFKKGTDSLMFWSSHEKSKKYQVPTKVYCSNCNSPIMDEGRNMCLIFPELIDLGKTEEEHLVRRKVFEIDHHIFYSRRLVEVHDGKPKWSELDDKSNRLDDDGNKI
ncbi:conserved hypothetical protein [Talaromyces stipitatus ATCC 10500]|uniref:CENP-V/GFA domain-containing protein n=1 Tax=Talaromyces stipitatus (strain ATCC 10500 / CBS 375.48 / QM 6759 / NRRL 1006) TaxID=441959 RepID=B8MAU2_TALSN|nr:uncharacterized protein TSTA_115760 [Talaromyces stipitatus ATCC 10500]EED17782.1 conserved hypothetical protein [Talaromyces stipitatus ATCC 10500]